MAQVGALALLAGAVAAFGLLPIPSKVEPPKAGAQGGTPSQPADTGPAMDFHGVSESLAHWDKKQEQPAGDETVAPTGKQDPPQAGPQIKYLGAIVEPKRLVAIVESEGSQHLAWAGAVIAGVEVREVRTDAIVIADGSAERTIMLQPRNGALIGSESAARISGDPMEGEYDTGAPNPKAMTERRVNPGAKRPTPPTATKGVPRPRPTPPATSGPQSRPRSPDGM